MTDASDFGAVSVVTFDAVGTLFKPHPSVGAVYREVAVRHGRDYDVYDLEQAFRNAFTSVSKNRALSNPEEREWDFWKRVVGETVRAVGDPPDDFDAFFVELWHAFAEGARWAVFPDVVETLGILRARGYRLGIISNWDRRIHAILEAIDLRRFFDVVAVSSEVGAEKPEPAIFAAAEAAFQAVPSECLHVGDSRVDDVRGARDRGWHALLLCHGQPSPEQDAIDGFKSIPPLLPARLAN